MDKVDLQVTALVNAGFDATLVANLVKQYGPEVLNLLTQGIEAGLTKDLMIAALQLGGKIVLAFLAELKFSHNKMSASPSFEEADRVDVLPGADAVNSLLLDTIIKMLPQLLNQYGPVLIQKFGPVLLDWVTQLLTKK